MGFPSLPFLRGLGYLVKGHGYFRGITVRLKGRAGLSSKVFDVVRGRSGSLLAYVAKVLVFFASFNASRTFKLFF